MKWIAYYFTHGFRQWIRPEATANDRTYATRFDSRDEAIQSAGPLVGVSEVYIIEEHEPHMANIATCGECGTTHDVNGDPAHVCRVVRKVSR